MNETDLILGLKKGTEKAQTEFYALFRDRLIRTATYFLGFQDSDVEDVVQETFIVHVAIAR